MQAIIFTSVGNVACCFGLSNIMVENRFTILTMSINSSKANTLFGHRVLFFYQIKTFFPKIKRFGLKI